MTDIVGVYGASGCGRGILPLLRDVCADENKKLVFVDDGCPEVSVNGHDVFTWEKFLSHPSRQKEVCIAIANPLVREKIALKCESAGISLRSAIAKNAVFMDDVSIGEGGCISPFVTITSNISIGKCFHANLYSYVEHDCVIGDFVTFAPGAKCNGNIIIEDHVYVGAGAIIRQGKPNHPMRIGKGATIGMGAIVTKDVPAGQTVIGNPASELLKV